MTNPQGATRVYQFVPGQAEATVITDYTMQPNGIGLSSTSRLCSSAA